MTVEDDQLRRITRGLYDIAHAMESADDAAGRVQRLLLLLQRVVPYERCALLEALPEVPLRLTTVPTLPPEEHAATQGQLLEVYRVVAGGEELIPSKRSPSHLTLPLVGMDQVLGVLRVEPPRWYAYGPQDLRLLAVVSAQLGAFLATVRLMEQRDQRTRELTAAHDFQQLMVGIVSHDLRNPLSVISTATEMLQGALRSDSQQRLLGRVRRNLRRSEHIIADLLDVTHARVTGTMPVNRTHCDLRAVVQEVVDDLADENPQRSITLACESNPVLTGNWDPQRLAQVVTNLVGNALQHGDPGEPVELTLGADPEGEVRLAVHNRGRSIPPELLPNLFDPFKQGPQLRARAAGDGLGLGLFIVASIVRAHGGRVAAESSPAAGTTFSVTLPPQADGQAPAPAAVDMPLVLVVDDTEASRELLAELLGTKGYRVAVAENGVAALSLLKTLPVPPRVMLVDLQMPEMDGWGFCEEVQADPRWKEIPVVVVSGYGGPQGLPRHARGFVPKPVDIPALTMALARFV